MPPTTAWAPPANADAAYARFPKDLRATATDGTPIAYAVLGDDGPHAPVIFASGWSCSDAYWAYLAPALAEAGHPSIVVDTRGHGASGLPRSPGRAARNLTWHDLSIPRIADDMIDVLDDTVLPQRGRAVVIGHSMGVQVALETYRRHPGRVAGLVLVAGPYENPLQTFYGGRFAERLFPFMYLGARAVPELLKPLQMMMAIEQTGAVGARLVGASGNGITAADLGPYLRHLASRDPGFLCLLADGMRRHSAADMLETIAVPTLILAGGRDPFCPPRLQSELHRRVRGSEIRWFDEAGHTLPLEEPDAVAEAVTSFLAANTD